MKGLTYKDAGVDIDAGEALVERIKPLAAATRIPEQLSSVGGFAGLCGLPAGLEEPILVSGTDGVGTKLKLAFLLDRHDTIGIDLVAMCVNDVVTVGARPLFFLDYFGTGSLDVDQAEAVVRGIAEGCKQAGCALLGGETAELPGFYKKGEYDLAGFAVGVVDRKKLIDGTKARAGDKLIALASSGLHSNGYSLARKALLEIGGLDPSERLEGSEHSLGEALLAPTRIYARAVEAALSAGPVHAISHITGGGIPGNLPRVLPKELAARLDLSALPRSPLFELIERTANVSEAEMRRTFNMGAGLILAIPPEALEPIIAALQAAGEEASIVGELIPAEGREGEARVIYAEDA